jgi:UDP-4-amino-4-deoxy-L-arabinose-oxoglutarate aminotransferase
VISHSKPWLTNDDAQAVNTQLALGSISTGAQAALFGNALKDYLDTKHLFTTANGTNAIYVALLALGIGKNDEVVMPAYVCKNISDAVVHAGATSILCDIGDYWRMTPENVRVCITPNTKAIIVVHALGIYCDIDSFREFGLPIIEDCCQFFANDINGLNAGTKGDISVYSFHATKCLTTGEGGGISTEDDRLAEKLSDLLSNKSVSNPLSDLQCALGLSQLSRYNEGLRRRSEIASIYFAKLPSKLTNDFSAVKTKSIFFRFLLTSDIIDFNQFQKYMFDKGIAVRRGIDSILNKNSNAVPFKNADKTLKRTISIPIYPSLSDKEVAHIYKAINKYEII